MLLTHNKGCSFFLLSRVWNLTFADPFLALSLLILYKHLTMMRRLKILWISIEYILIFMDAILIWITIDEILISLIMRNDGFPYFCINQVIRRWLLLSDVISVFDTAWLGVLMLVIYRRVWRMQCNFYACEIYDPCLVRFWVYIHWGRWLDLLFRQWFGHLLSVLQFNHK